MALWEYLWGSNTKGLYHLNWNTNDSMPYYNQWTSNWTVIVTWKFWNARQKNTNTNFISFWTSPIVNKSNFSINYWVYPTDVTTDQTIIATDGLTSQGSFLISITNLQLWDWSWKIISFTPNINSWNNIIITVQSWNVMRVYLNWTQVWSWVWIWNYTVTKSSFRIFERTDWSIDVANWTIIDDFAVYDWILTDADINNLWNSWNWNLADTVSISPIWYWKMNETSWTTISNNIGIIKTNSIATNIIWMWWKVWSWAASFNWTDSNLVLPQTTDFDITNWTWNFIIKLNSATASMSGIFDHWDETTWSWKYAWFVINHWTDWTNKFRTEVAISNWNTWNYTENKIDYWISDTNYHLLTITLTWTTTKIYFDWVLKNTKTDHSVVNYSTHPNIYIWCNHREYWNTNVNFLNWIIDEIIIENTVWQENKILKHYTASLWRFIL